MSRNLEDHGTFLKDGGLVYLRHRLDVFMLLVHVGGVCEPWLGPKRKVEVELCIQHKFPNVASSEGARRAWKEGIESNGRIDDVDGVCKLPKAADSSELSSFSELGIRLWLPVSHMQGWFWWCRQVCLV